MSLMRDEAFVMAAPPVRCAIHNFGVVSINKRFAWPLEHPSRKVLLLLLVRGFAGFARFGIAFALLRGFSRGRAGIGSWFLVKFANLGFQSKDLGLFIRESEPFSTFNQDLEFVAGKIHEAINSESHTIIIILLFLFNVATEVGVLGREVTLE